MKKVNRKHNVIVKVKTSANFLLKLFFPQKTDTIQLVKLKNNFKVTAAGREGIQF